MDCGRVCRGMGPPSSDAPPCRTATAQRVALQSSRVSDYLFFLFVCASGKLSTQAACEAQLLAPQIKCKWVFAERSQALPLLLSENCPCRNVDYRTTFKHLPFFSPPAASAPTDVCLCLGIVCWQSALVFHLLPTK